MKTQQIERYLAGDLTAADRRLFEARIAADQALRAKIEQRRQDKAAFMLDPRRRRFASLAAEAQAAEPTRRSWGVTRLALAGALAMLAVAVVWIARPTVETPGSRIGGEAIGVKGGVAVQLAVQSAGRVEPYIAGTPMRPGDRVRISVDDPHGGYVTVLVEDEHSVSVLYRPDEIGRLRPGRHLLPGSLQLDAMTGRERLYILVSPELPSADGWRDQIEAARATGFDHGWLPDAPTRMTAVEYHKVAQ